MDVLDAAFAALSDPTRRALLASLSRDAASVNKLAQAFSLSLPTVSRHLKVLEAAGLVSKQQFAQFRICHLKVAPLAAADDWLGQFQLLMANWRSQRSNRGA